MKTRSRKKTTQSLADLGEFGLIDALRRMPLAPDSCILTGIGDDAAVLRDSKSGDILFTTDMLIQDRHFRLKEASPFEIGRKAMGVNLSDIAAMGGHATHAVVSLGLPAELSVSFVLELYRGLIQTGLKFGVSLVGGDTNESDRIVISVAMIGRTFVRGQAVLRSGAKIGDVIFVSGALGGSYASRKHLRFVPRLQEAEYLVKNFKIHSMIDLSDGLASDLRRLTKESEVGAFISKEMIPLSKSARGVQSALSDGEDFELLFTLSPRDAARLVARKLPKSLAPFRPIGKIVDKSFGVKLLRVEGAWEVLAETGFDHFKNEKKFGTKK